MVNEDIKFEDIDPNFLKFKPSSKLPSEIKKVVEFHFNKQKNRYLNYGTEEQRSWDNLFSMYWEARFLEVFSHNYKEIWLSLYEVNEKAAVGLAKFLCGIGMFTSVNGWLVKHHNETIMRIKTLQEKLSETLFYLNVYGSGLTDDGGWDYYDEETRNRVIPHDLHDCVKLTIEAYLARLDFIEPYNLDKNNDVINGNGYPVSRKRNADNADAVFFAKILNQKFKFFFKKPHHDHVATFINAVFDTDYDYAAVTQLVRKR